MSEAQVLNQIVVLKERIQVLECVKNWPQYVGHMKVTELEYELRMDLSTAREKLAVLRGE